MGKLEVKLKQHTPLIHFQWEQEGTTLRASEVKPQLDKFIISKMNKEFPDSWLIRKDPRVLNYKMCIKLEKYLTIPFSNISSAKEKLKDRKVEFASLDWYCDCLVENVSQIKKVLDDEGIPFKKDETIHYKVRRKWPLIKILCRLGKKTLSSPKKLYIEIASNKKLIEEIIGEKYREKFLVLSQKHAPTLRKNKVDYFQDDKGQYCLVKSKNANKLNNCFSNEELKEIEKYILVKQEDHLDLSEKLKKSGIKYGYFTQEDELLVFIDDEKSFQILNEELEKEMGLKSIFKESDSTYLHISGLSREQRDILEREKIQYILLKDRCKYIVHSCNSEEIYKELRKANIECEFEDLSEEYLVGVNLKPVSQVLKANAISFLSSTPFFAQEDIIKGQKEEIITDKKPFYCFNWNRWRKIDGKIIDKKGLLYPGNIIVGIECQNEDLLKKLEEQIEAFFICHNFGTRQDKGFGSFKVVGKMVKERYEECKIDPVAILKENFDFVYRKRCNDKTNLFEIIQNDYRLIKSGNNYPYAKSKIFLYGLAKGVRWEKRLLKKNINKNNLYNENGDRVKLYYKKEPITGEKGINDWDVSNITNNWNDVPDAYQYEFLRAVLGLTEQYEFLLRKEGEDKPDYSDKIIVKVINVDKEKIERYKSPLFFKVIDNVIYLIGNNELLQGNFYFEIFVKSNPNQKIPLTTENGKILQLSVPGNFSLSDFMKFVMKEKEFAADIKGYGAPKYEKIQENKNK